MIMFAIFANAAMAPIDSLQTPVVVEVLAQNATYLSLLNVCLTVGVLVGGAVYPAIQAKVRVRLLFPVCCCYIMFLYLLIAFVDFNEITATGIWYYGFIVCYLLYGLFAGFLTTGLGIQLMAYTEQEYMSRINTIFTAFGEAVIPVVSMATGLLLNYFDIKVLFLLVALCILISLGAMVLSVYKNN